MSAKGIENRRIWLVVAVFALVLFLAAMGAHAESPVFDNAVPPGVLCATSDRDPANAAGFGQQISDDFVLEPAAHVVTGVEWVGQYGVLGLSTLSDTYAPDTDEFTLVFQADDGGVPGNVISEYRPRDVTRVALGNGSWSYRYSLPNPLELRPGHTYYLSIVNNIPGNAYWGWSLDDRGGTNLSSPTSAARWLQWPGNCAFRLTYTEPPAPDSAALPMLGVGIVAIFAFGLHRRVL